MPAPALRQTLKNGLHATAVAGRGVWESCCGLTPREREGALLVAALFVFGLAVQLLRWLLGA